uniref:Lysyl oxidase homolog n=1 Tax=Salarias fasciatus TaxID=181472 RepID=A0A672H8H2_SALFA
MDFSFSSFSFLQLAAGPWRHRIQWHNNGQVYSLMSTGSEYQAPVRSRPQSRVYVSSRRDGTVRGAQTDSRQLRSDHSAASGPFTAVSGRASGARAQPERAPGAVRLFNPEYTDRINSSSPGPSTGQPSRRGESPAQRSAGAEHGPTAQNQPLRTQTARLSEAPAPPPAAGDDGSNEATFNGDGMVNDDPRNPFKNHRNSVFYNMHPSRGRTAAHMRRPPGTGYGTRYFQNGLPDLVPDPYAIQAGAYIQRMQMFALRCAAEENCLARSAYMPTVRDIDFRVLLRFPQKVKNQGTTDFLPVKPRYQWDWHSCHQHFHSMDAFSNYDLLDVASGRRVAEGHKASFCLEDTGCEAGFRRRYACTAHTQGLSPGCHDVYAANIDCQWIDITDVPPGNYILKVTVNPDFHVLESDFTNNIVRCEITYTGVYVQTRNCRITRY